MKIDSEKSPETKKNCLRTKTEYIRVEDFVKEIEYVKKQLLLIEPNKFFWPDTVSYLLDKIVLKVLGSTEVRENDGDMERN